MLGGGGLNIRIIYIRYVQFNPPTIADNWIGFVGVWGGGLKVLYGGLKFSENLSPPQPPTKNVTYLPTKTLIYFKYIYLKKHNLTNVRVLYSSTSLKTLIYVRKNNVMCLNIIFLKIKLSTYHGKITTCVKLLYFLNN